MKARPARIVVLQHHPAEGPGRLADWAAQRGHSLRVVQAWASNEPDIDASADALVLLGGPWHLGEAPAWFLPEQRAVQAWVDTGRATLGICLGSQLLAQCLGGHVIPLAVPEAGWLPVQFDDGQALQVLHWHEQAVVLPRAAVRRARSAGCEVQAFEHGPTQRGLQFHPEWDAASVDRLNAAFGAASPLPREHDAARHAAVEAWFFAYLDDWMAASLKDL
jgi:GMP synthase-like glutamine amidotransferase